MPSSFEDVLAEFAALNEAVKNIISQQPDLAPQLLAAMDAATSDQLAKENALKRLLEDSRRILELAAKPVPPIEDVTDA